MEASPKRGCVKFAKLEKSKRDEAKSGGKGRKPKRCSGGIEKYQKQKVRKRGIGEKAGKRGSINKNLAI